MWVVETVALDLDISKTHSILCIAVRRLKLRFLQWHVPLQWNKLVW